jgi:Transposase DDE domain
MAAPPTAPAAPETAGSAETPQPSRDPERRLLRPENRLPMAHASARVPALEDGVPLLPGLAHRRHLGEDEPGDAKTAKGAPWPRSRTKCGDRGHQSAKTTGVGGEQRGFDGGKKVRGRKRHILVDTEGLVVEARVHSAKVPDQDGIRRLLERARTRSAPAPLVPVG